MMQHAGIGDVRYFDFGMLRRPIPMAIQSVPHEADLGGGAQSMHTKTADGSSIVWDVWRGGHQRGYLILLCL
jgi:hypothetical protein